jgi:hypothetical protein
MIALLLAAAVAAATPSEPPSCKSTAGEKMAAEYVKQCLEVTPATHPPCNAANSCELIQREIKRGCDLLPEDDRKPYCKAYQTTPAKPE